MLRLTAWRLSGDSPVRQASLHQGLANLPSVGENLLDWTIRLAGESSDNGAEASTIGPSEDSLRAHNSEDSGIFFWPFYSKQRRLLYWILKATERCFRLCLSSVFGRFRSHLFFRTWCAPLRSRLLAHYIIRLHGIWTWFWSTCQAPLLNL